MNKVEQDIRSIFEDVGADGFVKLPFKYKDSDVYEATYERFACVGRFPPYALVKGNTVREPSEKEAEEIFKLSYTPTNKIASAGYDTEGMSDEWAERLAGDIN